MLPLTDLLGETVMVPFADAEVLTGGTSWSPDRLTFKPLRACCHCYWPPEQNNVMADDKTLIA